MNTFMRILGFIGTAVLGYAGVFLVFVIALKIVNTLPADENMYAFKTFYFGGGLISCIIATGLGILRFFTSGVPKKIFTWIPVVLPIAYCTFMMTYFSLYAR